MARHPATDRSFAELSTFFPHYRQHVVTALSLSCAPEQVFAKGAKFSMFKPAEEMVYIGLDEQSRTKGKAAIDVVGAQTGKSVGSILQQVSPASGRAVPAMYLLLASQGIFSLLTHS